jgi:hypothetical protein
MTIPKSEVEDFNGCLLVLSLQRLFVERRFVVLLFTFSTFFIRNVFFVCFLFARRRRMVRVKCRTFDLSGIGLGFESEHSKVLGVLTPLQVVNVVLSAADVSRTDVAALEKIVFGTELGEKEIKVLIHILQRKNIVLNDNRRTFHYFS